jgi:hypothetical protein
MPDWRVTVRLTGGSRAARAVLHGQIVGDLRRRLPQLAEVSVGKSALFIYADTSGAAHEAAEIARELTGRYQLDTEVRLDRWHPADREWDDDAQFLTRPDRDIRNAEHEHRITEDLRRFEETGVAQWTVRLTLSSRRDAADLVQRLAIGGVTAARRGKVVEIGASHEDAARQLAQRVAEQAPGASLEVKRTFIWSPPIEGIPLMLDLSGRPRKFVGSEGGLAAEADEVDGAGGVEGFLRGADREPGDQDGVLVAVVVGGVDRKAERSRSSPGWRARGPLCRARVSAPVVIPCREGITLKQSAREPPYAASPAVAFASTGGG